VPSRIAFSFPLHLVLGAAQLISPHLGHPDCKGMQLNIISRGVFSVKVLITDSIHIWRHEFVLNFIFA
jgi:hypothetical protein